MQSRVRVTSDTKHLTQLQFSQGSNRCLENVNMHTVVEASSITLKNKPPQN